MPTADLSAIQSIMGRVRRGVDVGQETALFADGLGLDSLETAELSALLEDEFGEDPFSQGQMPGTVGELLAFYDASPAR
jgi:acyl carrier protein